ncbi:MAG: DUF3231 family protein [Syntrophomonadaceae bacterium]
MNEQQNTIGSVNYQEVPIHHNARLTSSEIAQLWATFMEYTMLNCIFSYFERVVKDPQTKELMSEIIPRTIKRSSFVAEVFSKESIPIPMGFTENDVNLSAPPLFSEIYLLHYLRNMIRLSMTMNALNLNMASRPDVIDFYTSILESTLRLNKKVTDFMMAKGILPRAPYVTISPKVEHIHKPEFLTGFFGEKRPLLTAEVAHLYHNALTNEVGRACLLAFRQVSPHKEVQAYLTEGIELADIIIDSITSMARKEHIMFSFMRDLDATDSTTAPFSDRLIMFHVYLLNTIGAGMYGVSGAVSARHDIMAMYGKFMAQVGIYAEQGAKLMMKNDWLEEPPQILDREKIAELKH